MAIFTDAENIQNNLPRNARFRKNGSTRTVAQAITDALDSTKDSAGNFVWQKALAYLLRSLAADYAFQSFTAGDASYSQSKLLDLAEYWEAKAPDDGDEEEERVEGFSSIPATRSGGYCCDENSAGFCG